MKNLVVVIALGVALLVFSVVAIVTPHNTLLRVGDIVEPCFAALVRVSGFAVDGTGRVAKRIRDSAVRMVGSGALPSPTLSEGARVRDGERSAGSAAEEGADVVAKRHVDRAERAVEPRTASAPALSGRARVIDGDTIALRGERIRLFGIDAPESAQTCRAAGAQWHCGERATRALAGRIGGSTVACEERDRDRYGRIVALCRAAGVDLNAWMVQSGLALAYRRFSSAYTGEERAARAARLGIWRGDFVAPWDWRNGERLKGAVAARTRDTQSASGDCRIKGNINRSGERIYHVPGGAYYETTRLEPAKGERWFCSEGQARAAGWRRSKR